MFDFFKVMFDTLSELYGHFSGNGTYLYNGKCDSGMTFLSVWYFAYNLPKPSTNWFAHVNSKQPLYPPRRKDASQPYRFTITNVVFSMTKYVIN